MPVVPQAMASVPGSQNPEAVQHPVRQDDGLQIEVAVDQHGGLVGAGGRQGGGDARQGALQLEDLDLGHAEGAQILGDAVGEGAHIGVVGRVAGDGGDGQVLAEAMDGGGDALAGVLGDGGGSGHGDLDAELCW